MPTQSSAWWASCIHAFSDPGRLRPLVQSTQVDQRIMAPLVRKRWWLPLYELAGSSALREPVGLPIIEGGIEEGIDGDPLAVYAMPANGLDAPKGITSPDSTRTMTRSYADLIHSVLDVNRPVQLGRFPVGSMESESMEEVLSRSPKRIIIRREEHRIPRAAMAENWEVFEQRVISSSRRSSFRRLRRKLEEKGKVSIRVERPEPKDVSHHLEDMFQVEHSGWKGKGGSSILSCPATTSFFRDLGWRMARAGALTLFFLELEEPARDERRASTQTPGHHILASQLALTWGNRLWILKIGHDEHWSWASPGILLMNEVVRHCHVEALESCEFMGNDDPWLKIWATGYQDLVTYRIYPKTLAGFMARSIDRIYTIKNGLNGLRLSKKRDSEKRFRSS